MCEDRLSLIKENFGVESVREVEGYPGYAVSSCGRVFSWRYNPGKPNAKLVELRQHIGKPRPRRTVCLSKGNSNWKRCYVSRLVAIAYIPNPDGLPSVRHLNDDPADNRVSNLAWGTEADNRADAARNGKLAIGEKIGCARLTDDKVREIRKGVSEGHTQKHYAIKFDVSVSTISDVVLNINWKHVQ